MLVPAIERNQLRRCPNMFVIKFCILERIKDGRVVEIHPKPWTPAEAERYAKIAASQGETYHIVYCEARRPLSPKPTSEISFLAEAS